MKDGRQARSATSAAVLAGVASAFVAGVAAVALIRPGLLADPEPSWTPYRLVLMLLVAMAAAGTGAAAAAALLDLASRTHGVTAPLEAWPFGAVLTSALAALALAAGVALRFVALGRLPEWLWIDDLSLIQPALALQGRLADFGDAVRPVPFGVGKLYGTVGVLYLEGYRLALLLWGTTVFGVRFPSALAGVVSLATGGLLGRALLPRGGGALAVLALSGLRWHLILSRWGWNMIALVPIVDVATLLLVRARRRGSVSAALAAGAVAGLGAHVYLSAWVAGAALGAFTILPGEQKARGASFRLALLFAAGFAAAAAPLFLFHEGRPVSYFARTADHNVALEVARAGSLMPAASAAADALAAPWWLPDPSPRHDLPGAARLGFLIGVPVLVALARALLSPRAELSALFLCHAGAAFAATVAGGQAGNPNGSRYAYLTTVTALAAAAGALALIHAVPPARRRGAALAALGAFSVSGVLGARAALADWPERPETFEGFHGQDTLLARAALRWEALGRTAVEPGLGHSDVTIGAIRRFRLDGDEVSRVGEGARLQVRVAAPDSNPGPGERLVERVIAPGGRTVGLVFARNRT